MSTPLATNRIVPYRSIIFKNGLLFVLILVVAVLPLSLSHYEDSRDAEIQMLAAKLEVAAERGLAHLNAAAIAKLVEVEHRRTPTYKRTLKILRKLEQAFGVDDAILMRRQNDGRYTYIVIGSDDFDIGEYVQIHEWFPPTYEAAEQAWREGTIMHSRLFGGKVIDEDVVEPLRSFCRLLTFTKASDSRFWHRLCGPERTDYNYDVGLPQFVQINAPIALDGQVVAVLMLNKHANLVAEAVRAKTLKLIWLTLGIIAIGLGLFGYASAHMLRPLKNLTTAAGEVAQGNLEVTLPAVRRRDEVGRLTTTFSTMLDGLQQRDFIRDAFGRYLSKEIVEELLDSPDGSQVGW